MQQRLIKCSRLFKPGDGNIAMNRYSLKRTFLFNNIKNEVSPDSQGLKPLCPTRWTVCTVAIESVVENYEPLTQAMEEINRTSHDEYGAKVGRILAQLHTFDTYFGFKLSHLVFSATEQLSCFLQTKNVSLQEALRQAAAAVRFFERNRSDEAFCYYYKQVVEDFTEPPTLPRIRRTV